MHVIGTQVSLDDADVSALRKILRDDSFDEFAVGVERLQQIADSGKARMIEPGCRERIGGALFSIAEQLQAVGICL